MNPFNSSEDNSLGPIRSITTGVVTSAPSHTAGDNIKHHVTVSPDFTESEFPAEVGIMAQGDVSVPTEGTPVYLAMQPDGRAIVLGERYNRDDTIPDYEAGQRRVGHPLTDSHIELQADGTVHIENDAGTTVELQPDGDVVIDGGTERPVTDVSTSTDADGHVTGITLTRSSNVYIP